MKKQNLLILVLSLGAVFAISSCNNNNDSNSNVVDSSSSETTSSEETSSSEEESSSVIDTKLMVTIQYGEAYDNETETLECEDGDVIDLSEYSYINSEYECLGWSDGVNEYGPNDKVTVHEDMILTGNFVKVALNYTLSDDETYYIVSGIADTSAEKIEIPATYKDLPVKEIAGDAFSFEGSDSTLKELVVGENIATINKGAFAALQALEKITVPFFGENLADETSTFGYLFGASMPQMNGMVTPKTLKEVTITKQEVIPARSFDSIAGIEKVTLGNAKTINSYAFASMGALTTVSLNEGLVKMDANSFTSLSNLTSLNIPSTVEIYNNAISATGITSLHFGAALREYRNRNESTLLTEITVDEANTSFASVDGILYTKDMTTLLTYPAKKDITSFKIPDGTTIVGENAFMYAKITSVDLNKVEVIDNEGFRYSKLTSVTFPDTITRLGKTSFSGTPLTSINFPATLKNATELTAEEFLFSSCDVLKEITVPAYIVDIPRFFVSADNLEKVTFLGSLKSIEEKAFAGSKITELDLTFKDSAKIGNNIFMNCGDLTRVYIHFEAGVTNYPTLTSTGFYYYIPNFVCDNDTIANALKEKWTKYKVYISTTPLPSLIIDNEELVGFIGTAKDKNVVIPETVKSIGNEVFNGKSYIESVVIPASLEKIGTRNFVNCENLKTIEFLSDFPGTDLTGSVSFPSNVVLVVMDETAKKDLFNKTRSESIYTKDEIVVSSDMIISKDGTTLIRAYNIVDGTFEIPEGVTTIAPYCFRGVSELTTIDLTGIETIGNSAFYETSLTEVVFPESVTYIGNSAFMYVTTLKSIKIEGAATIDEYAFDTCSDLEKVDFGDKLVAIGQGAFANAGENNGIEYVILPASLESLNCEAFADSYIKKVYCRFSEEYGNDTFEDFEYFVSDYDYTVVFDYEGE